MMKAASISLWQECGLVVPWNDPQADIARKYDESPELFFVADLDQALIASCMSGYDGHRGWIYFMAVKTTLQRKGIATKLVEHVETKLIELGYPKVELMVRKTNSSVISFYRSIGYNPEPVVVMSKRLIEDRKHDYG